MFSFFKSSKKHSPVESPETSDASPQQDPDDFIVIENRNKQQPVNPYQQRGSVGGGGVYPTLGPGMGGNASSQYPQAPVQRQDSNTNFHYLQGVPFKLSSDISTGGDTTEVMRIQVDEILASVTRLLDMTSDYEFTLEQNTIAQ